MDGEKTFSFWHDFEQDALIVKTFDGQKHVFTKEFLQDTTAHKFMQYLFELIPPKSLNIPKLNPKPSQIAELLSPGIDYQWHDTTGGHAKLTWYDPAERFWVRFSQGFKIDLPTYLNFSDDKHYSDLKDLVVRLGNMWMKGHIPPGAKVIEIGGLVIDIAWKKTLVSPGQAAPPPNKLSKDEKVAMFASLYGSKAGLSDMAKATEEVLKTMTAQGMADPKKLIKKQAIKALHVYDLGEGMLVPCEMVHELANVLGGPVKKKPNAWSISKEMLEDDLYGSSLKDQTSVLQHMIDVASEYYKKAGPQPKMIVIHSDEKSHLENILKEQMYPGKVWMVDDPAQIEIHTDPMLTSPDSWFILDNGILDTVPFIEETTKLFNEIAKHNVGKYGKPLPPPQEPASVALPKKPKQITKETLDYFHKMLGGKKDPFTK